MRAGDGLGDGAERAVHLPVAGEAVCEDFDFEGAAFLATGQDRSRPQTLVRRHPEGWDWR